MLDTDESSSEANIIVLGIVDVPDSVSIHKYKKKISVPIIRMLK